MMRLSLQGQAAGEHAGVRTAALLVLAALYGTAIALLPWTFAIAIFIAPMLIFGVWRHPELGWLLIGAMLMEVIPSALQPTIELGAGSIKSYDLLMGLMLAAVLFRLCWQRPAHKAWPPILNVALLYVFAAVAVSVAYVIGFRHNPDWISEARVQLLWLLLPLAALAVDTPARHRRLILGVIAFGGIIAVYMVLQGFADLHIMTDARIEPLDIYSHADVTRSNAGGAIYLLVFALILSVNALLQRRASWLLAVPAVLLLSLGLAVQYGRGIWLATAVGLLLAAFLYRGIAAAVSTCLLGAVAIAVLLGGISLARPRIAEALIERATGIVAEVGGGESLRWRFVENRDALRQIAAHPLLGVGIGGEYKAMNTHSFPNETRYLHNGYLYFPLKCGLWTAGVPLMFVAAFIVVTRRVLARAPPGSTERLYAACLAGAALVPVMTCVTQPEWADVKGLAAIVMLFSLQVLLYRDGLPGAVRTPPDPATEAA